MSQDTRLPGALASFIDGHPYVVATAHRRESWGSGIRAVADAVASLTAAWSDLRILFVTHPNPLAKQPVVDTLANIDNVLILDALAYPTFVKLLAGAVLAISDSGGIQEEGPTLGVPVLVTRKATERPEGVEAGAVLLVGTDRVAIIEEANRLISDESRRREMGEAARQVYGDGRAAQRIAAVVCAGIESDLLIA
jgi:UDP-N-acetylglucosamine 2-epimerase (non-hydrolysing)